MLRPITKKFVLLSLWTHALVCMDIVIQPAPFVIERSVQIASNDLQVLARNAKEHASLLGASIGIPLAACAAYTTLKINYKVGKMVGASMGAVVSTCMRPPLRWVMRWCNNTQTPNTLETKARTYANHIGAVSNVFSTWTVFAAATVAQALYIKQLVEETHDLTERAHNLYARLSAFSFSQWQQLYHYMTRR